MLSLGCSMSGQNAMYILAMLAGKSGIALQAQHGMFVTRLRVFKCMNAASSDHLNEEWEVE